MSDLGRDLGFGLVFETPLHCNLKPRSLRPCPPWTDSYKGKIDHMTTFWARAVCCFLTGCLAKLTSERLGEPSGGRFGEHSGKRFGERRGW